MLDNGTKRRIDTARDILVGKIPDPKSQVEQITIALIYKFMDDMDAEAEELGGSRKFFADGFSKYGWARLMHTGLGGHEMLNLYAEAISRMPENPGIPPLFRNIFKNAYLPYRDPETLRSFLKIIDEFSYDHSERLGDAFEYLLSVLGSQGDAGQFRTPRHIIDFIVEIVAPQKDETVLDPACGTAGFLISSYKHMLKNNLDENSYSTLTPDEKGRIVENFKGYDISPDMVRLSLVNLYLHGFSDPHIYEYDTLTSQERWNEYADVILANPPFMSPKGGIRPHNRFSVQSKRSEVLFVDYIADHLTPAGRAGVIVPEGIIFQSQNAYKQLRKKLVEESLVAVISLPSGVFQPYSGVKTSILILDKALSQKADSIAFFKVENDGFGLGAQRRPIDKNDLPQELEEVKKYLDYILNKDRSEEFLTNHGLVVKRAKVAENGDYNLSGERYRENMARSSNFPLVGIKSVCTFEYGYSLPKPKRVDGPYPVVGSNGITGCHNEYSVEGPVIIVGRKGSAGQVTYIEDNCFPIDTTYFIKLRNKEGIDLKYLYRILKSIDMEKLRDGAGIPGLNREDVYNTYKIPLPPLEIQKEIVAEIESYQKIIDGARTVVENYRPHIPIDPNWPIVELGDVCDFKRGPFGGSLKKEIFINIGYAVYEQSHAIKKDFSNFRYFIDEEKFLEMKGFQVNPGDLIMSCSGTMGKIAIVPNDVPPGIINQALLKLSPNDNILPLFLKLWIESSNFQHVLISVTNGAAIKNVASVTTLKCLQLPLPPLPIQKAIVSEIEAEQSIVKANRELIERFEKKIENTINRVWGEEG